MGERSLISCGARVEISGYLEFLVEENLPP